MDKVYRGGGGGGVVCARVCVYDVCAHVCVYDVCLGVYTIVLQMCLNLCVCACVYMHDSVL